MTTVFFCLWFSRMRSEGCSFNLGVWGYRAVFARRCFRVRNRSQPFGTVRNCSQATVRNRSQVFESELVGESSQKWLFMDVSRARRHSTVICMKVVCHARKVMDFAAQAQGFVKVTRCDIGICIAECLPRSSLLREVTFGESLVRNARFGSLDFHFGESLVENTRFGSLDSHFWWKSRGKCSFWKLGFSLLVTVSWKMLVLEAWILTFGDSLVENARFASLDSHFWWKSRGKCLSWKLGFSLLVKVSRYPARVSCQECPARAASKSVKKKCRERMSSKSALSRVSSKSV